MTFWAIIFFSLMSGMSEPGIAGYPDKESCIAEYERVTPQFVARAPDLLTTGGCIEVRLISAAKKIQIDEGSRPCTSTAECK